MHALSLTRRGSALVVSSIVVITIAGMSIALTNLSIGRFGEQKARQAQVDLLAATESAANEAISWMRINTAVQTEMKNLTISSPGYPTADLSTSAVLVSSSLPSGLPAVFPSLTTGSTASGTGANTEGIRNSCAVTTKVIKVASSATPSVWDGTERFIIYTTAMSGDSSRPDTLRRQRVETVVTAISTTITTSSSVSVPTPAYPFTRGLFSTNGFNVSGAADTDSWNSDPDKDGIHTAYVAPASYTVGGANAHGDIGSNGVLGSGAYDTSKVHGTATPNANATLPAVTYNPPSSGYTSLATITGNTSIAGSGTGSTIYRIPSINQSNNKALTITGSGTVVIYVDGVFNVGDINFQAGSTAKLVIYQNDVSGGGCSFNSQNTIGDPKDPSRFIFATAFSGTGSNEMKLNGGASFSGVVLAPNAGIKFNGNSDFYGSFVAKDFSGTVNGNFSFHYDEGLAGLSWGTVMTTTTTTTPTLSMLSPTAWNVRSIGYGSP
jgi:hypothetical protein